MGIIARQSIKASLVGLVGVAIGAFSRLFLYTKFLSASEIGILETIIKLGVLMTPLFVIGSPQVITRFYNRFETKVLNDGLLYTYSILMVFFLVPISSVLFILNKNFIFSLYKQAPELENYYLLPLTVAIAYGGFSFLRSISVVNLRITIPTFLSGVLDRGLVVVVLLAYGAFHWININQFLYLNIFVFFIIPFVLMLAYLIVVIKPSFAVVSFKEAIQILRKTSAYNAYLIFGTLSSVIIAAIDVNMISGKLGTELAGIYTIAFFMGTVIEIPRRSLTNIIYPILNKAVIDLDKVKVGRLYQKSSVNQFLVGAFMFLLVWINIDDIFAIIPNGENFVAGKLVVLFIGLSKLFDMMMGVNRQIIELSKYYRLNLFINIALSILVIGLNLFFINLDSPVFGGINGVAFASLLAMVLVNIFSLLVVWKKEQLLPFSSNMFKCIIPLIIVYLLHGFIDVSNSVLSILLRSIFCVLVFTLCTYYFRISEDFILILRNILKRIK